MDDWISLVYGSTRTFKSKAVHVLHHTGAHGQRYSVDHSHEGLLSDLVLAGRQKIRRWMLVNNRPERELKMFDSDEFRREPGWVHLDVPKAGGTVAG